jgi:hypothetical protein
MALGIYYAPNINSQYNEDRPFSVTFDGRVGGAQDLCVYIRNDDSTRWYDNIVLTLVDGAAPNIITGVNVGWDWRMMEKSLPPLHEEWGSSLGIDHLHLSADLGSNSLGDVVTYLPIWVRITIPDDQPIQVINDVVLQISATEHLVGA